MVPAGSDRVSRARPYSGTRPERLLWFRVRDDCPLWCDVPVASATTQLCNSPTRRQTDQDEPYNPTVTTAAAYHVTMVWALPFSLATTQGIIIIFFSCGYLDVSVLRVGSLYRVMHLQCNRLSHSEIFGYNARVQLPEAYRSLPRPSSPHRP